MKSYLLPIVIVCFLLAFGIYWYPQISEITARDTPAIASDCSSMQVRATEQVGFAGIRVGESTVEEVVESLGEPTKIDSFGPREKQYIYSPLSLTDPFITNAYVNIHDNQVSSLYTFQETDYVIKDVIDAYGCPDFVRLQAFSEDMVIAYNGGSLVYLTEGVEFQFYGVPLSTEAPIILTTYFVPTSAENYTLTPYGSREEHLFTWSAASIWEDEQP